MCRSWVWDLPGLVLKSELRGNVLLHLFPLEDAMHSHWWPGKPRWTPPHPPPLNPLTPPAAAKPWHRFDYFARKEDKRWFDHFAGTKQKEEDLKLAKMSNYLQSSWGQTRAWNLHLRRSKFKIATYLALGPWMKCSFRNSTIILSSLMGESTYDEKDFSNSLRNI